MESGKNTGSDVRFVRIGKKKIGKKKKPATLPAILLFMLTLCALAYFGKVFVVSTFQNIVIEGTALTNYRDELERIGESIKGQRYFSLDEDDFVGLFAEWGPFKVESCKKTFPDTVELVVNARLSVAQIEFSGLYLVLDEEGIVVSVEEARNPNILLIDGAAVQSYSVGSAVNLKSEYRLGGMMSIATAIYKRGFKNRIAYLSVYNYYDYRIITTDGNVIHLGLDEDLSDKLYWLEQDSVWQLLSENPETELDLRLESPVMRWNDFAEGLTEEEAVYEESGES